MTLPNVASGTSIYIHVPFCASRCAYCDFLSTPVFPGGDVAHRLFESYCSAVMRDVRQWASAGVLGEVPTIYIGGGTPSVLGADLPRLVRELRLLSGVTDGTRINVEANPDSLDAELVGALADAGVSRVSLGVQSLDDDILAWLGRRHDVAQALKAAALLRSSGMEFSVDIMCGIPMQSSGSWEWTVADAIGTGAGHVSVYPLSVEESTPLFDRVESGHVPDVDPDAAAEQMTYAASALRAAGFERYEIASYAMPGRECAHNVRYWTGGAYVGIGPSAASMLRSGDVPPEWELGQDAARVRFTMCADLDAFLAGDLARPAEFETLSAELAAREDAMLGMRLSQGITAELAEAAQATEALRELSEAGLVEFAGGRWRMTERGWLLGNEVFMRMWTQD